MGSTYSQNDKEKATWSYHCPLFDESTRETNLLILDHCFSESSEIQLAKQCVNKGGLNYQHFFITDTVNFLELTSLAQNSEDFYNTNRVQCNTLPHGNFESCGKTKITPEIKERMKQVLGMCNVSLCLRNSEHVANYIFTGRWASLQMEVGGVLLDYFERMMTPDERKKINTFPSTISPKTVEGSSCPKLYSMINQQYTPTSFQYFSDGNPDGYNILVVGPTGAGKSRLINVFFNTKICDSKVSHKSVTRDVCFIEGRGDIIDLETKEKKTKKIVVADTVGLCDTEWDATKIIALLKGRISRNFDTIHAVFIVFKADRLLKEHVENIREIMKWLEYDKESNYLNFLFVGTCAENLSKAEKDELKVQAREILKLKDTKIAGSEYESLVYVGFPPEEQLNDTGKEQVKASWKLLQPLMRIDGNGQQLKDYQKHLAKEGASYTIKLPKIINNVCTIL